MKKYDRLYLRILEIGQGKLEVGLSYEDLKEILQEEGYDLSNGCIQLPVKHWFCESFFHVPAEDNPFSGPQNLDSHATCQFMLKGDQCLKLLEHQTAVKNNRIAFLAFVIALIALVYPIISSTFTGNNKNEKMEVPKSFESPKQQPAQLPVVLPHPVEKNQK